MGLTAEAVARAFKISRRAQDEFAYHSHQKALRALAAGTGPLYAIPEVLKRAGMKQDDLQLIELNEAFASQCVAIIDGLGLHPEIVNVNGGAIALGHPPGCTGAKLSVQLFDELRQRKQKYGMVTMCVGTGQGAAGIFELLD